MNKESVAKRISLAVSRYGNQRTMAKAMGVSEQYLSDMLRGSRPWSDDLLLHVGVERGEVFRDVGKPQWMK